MTIKIEQEAVLYVLSRAPSSALSPSTAYQNHHDPSRSHTYDDEAEIPVHPPKEGEVIIVPISSRGNDCGLRTFVPSSPVQIRDSPNAIDHDSDVPSEQRRRVTFAEPLVTDVRTRPRTLPGDLRALFYTYEETQRFRQEYRTERKMLATREEDPATVSTDDSSDEWEGPLGSNTTKRHRISRVVVRHQDTLETFYNGVSAPKACPTTPTASGSDDDSSSDSDSDDVNDFFDNDSFWSGSITWY